jgi:hypothetical protein
MKRGPTEFYKWHEIIQSEEDGQFYVYDFQKKEIATLVNLDLAREFIIDRISWIKKSDLEHDGVTVISYDHNDLIYMISVENTIFEQYPHFKRLTYSQLLKGYTMDWNKYLHNERGPANVCLEANQAMYFWHGDQLTRPQWEKAVHDKKFNGKMEEFIGD